MASPSTVSPGAITPWSTWGEFNNVHFAIMQAISKLKTATLVRVEACSNSGDLSPVGTVDITVLPNQVDGNGNPVPYLTIFGIPYLRMQGGTNAVILDPQEGDIGLAVFASRDISKVISTKAQANPGSARQYDISDALYVGGMLNASPQQYVQFTSDGITVSSPGTITLAAPTIAMNAGSTNLTLDSSGLSVTASAVTVDASGQVAVTATGTVDITGSDVSITPLSGGSF